VTIDEPDLAQLPVLLQGSRQQGLHGDLLEQLGVAITNGDLPTGAVVTIEWLESQYGVSRSVVREVVRVLESLGLAASRRRVGVAIMPTENWNLYDSQIIRWRLASNACINQLRALMEVRVAVEPEAARLAAIRSRRVDAGRLIGLAGNLWVAGEGENLEEFLNLDIEFHQLVLTSSGNDMFARLGPVVREMLVGRNEAGLNSSPELRALQLHVDVASAIQRGESEQAYEDMREVMRRTMDEITPLLDEAGLPG